MINSLIYGSIDRKMINSLNSFEWLSPQTVITLENTGIGDNDIVSGLDFGYGCEGQTVCHLPKYRIEVRRKSYRYYKWLDTLRYHSPARLVGGLNASRTKFYKKS